MGKDSSHTSDGRVCLVTCSAFNIERSSELQLKPTVSVRGLKVSKWDHEKTEGV